MIIRDAVVFAIISLSALSPIVAKTIDQPPVERVLMLADAPLPAVAPDLTDVAPAPVVVAPAPANDNSSTSIHYEAAFDAVVGFILTAISGLVGWAATWMQAHWRISLDEKYRTMLHDTLRNGVLYAAEKVKEKLGHGMSIDVKNEMVAIAGQYAVDNSPKILGYFKLDGNNPSDMTDLVTANAAKLGVSMQTGLAA